MIDKFSQHYHFPFTKGSIWGSTLFEAQRQSIVRIFERREMNRRDYYLVSFNSFKIFSIVRSSNNFFRFLV